MTEPSNSDPNGEIEPAPDAISDDEPEEPARKRTRVTGSSEVIFDKLIAEAVEKALKEKNIEESIKVIHKTTLGMSDSVKVGKLEEKILEMEAENTGLKQKMCQLELQVEKLHTAHLQNEFEKYQQRKPNGKKQKRGSMIQIRLVPTQQPRAHTVTFSSDDCKLPLTAGEQEYLNKCIFCESEEHKSMECKKVPEWRERFRKVSSMDRCERCLNVGVSLKSHSFFCPRDNVTCSDCYWGTGTAFSHYLHHPILCRLNQQTEDVKFHRQANNEQRQADGLPPRFVI